MILGRASTRASRRTRTEPSTTWATTSGDQVLSISSKKCDIYAIGNSRDVPMDQRLLSSSNVEITDDAVSRAIVPLLRRNGLKCVALCAATCLIFGIYASIWDLSQLETRLAL